MYEPKTSARLNVPISGLPAPDDGLMNPMAVVLALREPQLAYCRASISARCATNAAFGRLGSGPNVTFRRRIGRCRACACACACACESYQRGNRCQKSCFELSHFVFPFLGKIGSALRVVCALIGRLTNTNIAGVARRKPITDGQSIHPQAVIIAARVIGAARSIGSAINCEGNLSRCSTNRAGRNAARKDLAGTGRNGRDVGKLSRKVGARQLCSDDTAIPSPAPAFVCQPVAVSVPMLVMVTFTL